MLIIKNKYLPVEGFGAMCILGVLFVREGHYVTPWTLRHETIHTRQQYEIMTVALIASLVACNIWASWWYLLGAVVLPLVVYVLAWLVELALPPYNSAYKDSPFEREAFAHQDDPEYLTHRAPFAWLRYTLKWGKR